MAPKAGNAKKAKAAPIKLDGNGSVPNQMRTALKKNLARVIDLFRQVDTDESGMIDGPEFVKAIADFGIKAEEAAITALFVSFDPDDSGTIEYRELHQLLVRSMQSKPDLQPLDAKASNRIALRKKRISKADSNLLGNLDLDSVDISGIPNVLRNALNENKARVTDLFKQFDDDDSGLLDNAEFAKAISELGMRDAPPEAVAAVFKSFDPDESGTIEYKELHQLLVRSFQAVPQLEPLDLKAANRIALRTKRVLKRNANMLGGLDLNEDSLSTVPGQIKAALGRSLMRLIDLFRQFDDDASGTVEFDEFAKAMGELGLDVVPEALRDIFREFDPDGSGFIEYEELKTLFRKAEATDPLYKRSTLADSLAAGKPRAQSAQPQARSARSSREGGSAAAQGVGGGGLPAVAEERPSTAPAGLARPLGMSRERRISTASMASAASGAMAMPVPPTIAPAAVYWRVQPLNCKPVYLRAADGTAFTAFEIMGGRYSSVHRGAAKLVVVTHPIGKPKGGKGGQGLGLTPRSRWMASKVATRPLHQKLIDEGYNVLCYEAHPLAMAGTSLDQNIASVAIAATDADAQLHTQEAKLESVLKYVESHRVFRYCRVALLAQGVAATAALKLLTGEEGDDVAAEGEQHVTARSLIRMRALSLSQPVPYHGLVDNFAPRCPLPVQVSLAADGLPATAEVAESVHAALPESIGKELLTIAPGDVPLFGTAKRFDGAAYWSKHPEPLLSFLRRHI